MNETNPAKTNTAPSEEDVHAWVDGRMNDADQARMDAWLLRHPERAEEIRQWQHDAQQLRRAFGGTPDSAHATRLDPATIRAGYRHRRRTQLALAAALVFTLGVGAAGGWTARSRDLLVAAAPMADAFQAYRMFASRQGVSFDAVQHHPGQLQEWLDQHFRNAPRLPDLDAAGFSLVGARLLATDSGAAAMILYENAHGEAISFYLRPPAPIRGMLPPGQRRDGNLAATYWSGQDYNYALVSRDTTFNSRAVHKAALSPST